MDIARAAMFRKIRKSESLSVETEFVHLVSFATHLNFGGLIQPFIFDVSNQQKYFQDMYLRSRTYNSATRFDNIPLRQG